MQLTTMPRYEFSIERQRRFAWESRRIEYVLSWPIVVLHVLERGDVAWSRDAPLGREL
jgi:hypothetical protein